MFAPAARRSWVEAYRELVLPSSVKARVVVEAGIAQPWYREYHEPQVHRRVELRQRAFSQRRRPPLDRGYLGLPPGLSCAGRAHRARSCSTAAASAALSRSP